MFFIFFWNLSPCSSLTAPKFPGKNPDESNLCIFETYYITKFSVTMEGHLLGFCNFLPYGFLENFEKHSQNISRRVFLDLVFLQISCHLSLPHICGHKNIPFLIFASLRLGNFSFNYKNSLLLLGRSFTIFFNKLYVQRC